MEKHEHLSELIDKLSDIENLFVTEESLMGRAPNKPPIMRHKKTIRHNPKYLNWKDKIEYELGLLPQNDIVAQIKLLFQKIDSGWTEDSDFQELKSKLNVLNEHLDEMPMPNISDDEGQVCTDILKALITMQKNPIYKDKTEDELTDSLRDLMTMANYEVKDQTRQGVSESGKSVGEVDLLHTKEGFPKWLIEAMCLTSLSKENVSKHIHKALDNYNPVGLPYVFIIVYYKGTDLQSFWEKYISFISDYKYEYEKLSTAENIETGYAESMHCQMKLKRNGMEIYVHHYAVHIR